MAANVRAELSRSRISQAQAATRTSMSPAALSKRLNGYLPFDVDQLDAIATLLGVTPSDLLTRHDRKAVSA